MRPLSSTGLQAVHDLALRHGFSDEAVTHMLEAVLQGQGSMAQFNHPEFAGYGQWMRGGMTMVSDMFNNALKGRVDALCSDVSNLLAGSSGLFQPEALFVVPAPGTSSDWWGETLKWPDSTGAQNDVRYAYFAQARRLALQSGGRVTIYDTLDHQIGGVSQQQSGSGSVAFTSQYGVVDLAGLPVVSVDGVAPQAAPAYTQAAAQVCAAPSVAPAFSPFAEVPSVHGDVFAAIERLADLHQRGVLTAEEFSAKKAELLARI